MKPFILLYLLFCSALLVSYTPEAEKTIIELLTEKPWNYNSILEVKNASGQWELVPNEANSCYKDDSLYFYENGTYEVNAGKIRCESQQQIYRSGTWQLSKFKTMIKMDNYTLEIKILNQNTLQVIRKVGVSAERMTFVH